MRITTCLLTVLVIGLVNTSEINEFNITKERFVVNAVISQLFEIIRRMIFTGNPSAGVPILDPFVTENLKINVPSRNFRLNANITNGIFSGLGGFKILQSDFNKEEISIDFQCYLPSLVYHSDNYEMEGKLLHVFPLSGKGVLHFEAKNIRFNSKVHLKKSSDEKSILIKHFENPELNVETIICRTEIDNNIDPIVSAIVEDLLADFINRLSEFFAPTLSHAVIDALNPFLNKFESWRSIAVIL